MPLNFDFDFKNPDYTFVFKRRIDALNRLRKKPESIHFLKQFYKENPSQFIIDWGVTFDPRNVEKGLPSLCPFLLFPKQEEWINWFIDLWRRGKPGLTEKSREMGLSWLTVAVSVTMCLFHDGMTVGFGSRKQEYVDKIGDPKSLLQKIRQFLLYIPQEFKGSWDINKHAPHMRIQFPDTGSIISGESGDGIGRGDRASFYIVDESAWLPRPELVEASLSQTTNCRMDISTPHGMNNPFAQKRFSGKIAVFTFHWRDDPRKDQNWYNEKKNDIGDPVVIAQEIDLDYSASMEGIVIPAIWVRAAVDAHLTLNINPTGKKIIGLDVADEGKDKNDACIRHGILVEQVHEWSGENSDIFASVEKVFELADSSEINTIKYDSDGLGAGVRGDARVINAKRSNSKSRYIYFHPFRGSGQVIDPLQDPYELYRKTKFGGIGRTNEDFFENAKAQGWWDLRNRFEETYKAVNGKTDYNPDNIISLSSKIINISKVIAELSQPVYYENNAGKIIVDKMPDSAKSPNAADSVMIAFSRTKQTIGFWT
jgi:phage terminase large subunit